MLLIDAEFVGDAEALFLANPAKKCKVMDVSVETDDEWIRRHDFFKFSKEEILEAHRQESDEAMRRHFKKVGLK